jgi:hypothetical protein
MDAALRRYFASGRDSAVLWQKFDDLAYARELVPRRVALVRGARSMLERFLEWESKEQGNPVSYFVQPTDVAWKGHIVAIRRDLVYLTSNGYKVRQLWTDRELRVEHPDAGLMVAAVLICADQDLGDGRTEIIEAWQLRTGRSCFWTRAQLLREKERLRERLDQVAADLS